MAEGVEVDPKDIGWRQEAGGQQLVVKWGDDLLSRRTPHGERVTSDGEERRINAGIRA